MYLPNPFLRVGCDTRLHFKGSLTDFDLEFSFSKTGYHTKLKIQSIQQFTHN